VCVCACTHTYIYILSQQCARRMSRSQTVDDASREIGSRQKAMRRKCVCRVDRGDFFSLLLLQLHRNNCLAVSCDSAAFNAIPVEVARRSSLYRWLVPRIRVGGETRVRCIAFSRLIKASITYRVRLDPTRGVRFK